MLCVIFLIHAVHEVLDSSGRMGIPPNAPNKESRHKSSVRSRCLIDTQTSSGLHPTHRNTRGGTGRPQPDGSKTIGIQDCSGQRIVEQGCAGWNGRRECSFLNPRFVRLYFGAYADENSEQNKERDENSPEQAVRSRRQSSAQQGSKANQGDAFAQEVHNRHFLSELSLQVWQHFLEGGGGR